MEWLPVLVVCPPLLTAPGSVFRTLDLRVTFSGSSLLSVLSVGAWSLAQPPCPAPFREGLNRHHCQRPVMLWLCCPVTRPAWSGGNLQTITLHNRFYYHLFAHSHATVFSNNRSQGRVTLITSQCSSHNAHLHFHRPHVIVDCKLSLLIVIKILTISKLIAGLSCFF